MPPDLTEYDRCASCGHWRRDHRGGYDSDRCLAGICGCTAFMKDMRDVTPTWQELKTRELVNAAVLLEAQARQLRVLADDLRGTSLATGES